MIKRATNNQQRATNKGQTLMEYTIFIGVVVLALVSMNQSVKRGVQSVIKVAADQLAPQDLAEQNFETGYLKEAETEIMENSNFKQTRERAYNTRYDTSTVTKIRNKQASDLGFQPN